MQSSDSGRDSSDRIEKRKNDSSDAERTGDVAQVKMPKKHESHSLETHAQYHRTLSRVPCAIQ